MSRACYEVASVETQVECDPFPWHAPLDRKRVASLLTVLVLVVQSFAFSDATRTRGAYSDETVHMQQVGQFCDGGRTQHPRLTTFPGVHAIIAAVGTVAGDCSWTTARAVETVFGFTASMLALSVLWSLSSEFVALRTLQFYYLPLAFPFQFFVFTDIPSLACALAALLSMLRRRWVLASVLAVIGVALRQSNIVIPIFLGLVALMRHDKSGSTFAWLRGYLSKVWLSGLLLACFATFVLYNGGVAVGDRGRHSTGVHAGNVYFALALLSCVALPANLENLWKHRARLAMPSFFVLLAVAYVVYQVWFTVDHPFNLKTRTPFARNEVLHWASASLFNKTLFFVPIGFGLATLWVTALVSRQFWPVYLIALIGLVPEPLIETRYGMLAIAFWSLLRRDTSWAAECASALWNAAISLFLLDRIVHGMLL